MNQTAIKKIKTAPHQPGIYIFYKNKIPVYVGKAIDLKNRLSHYLQANRFESDRLSWQILSSGVEALIEESQLIKKLKPRFNIQMRDDKSYFYVAFTKEKFPRIFVTHLRPKPYIRNAELLGPFTEGRSLRIVLQTLRRYFPYCTCPKPHYRVCLSAQIGNCLGFCCQRGALAGEEEAQAVKQYMKNITIIKAFLLGKKKLKNYPKINERIRAFENILAHRDFLEYETGERTGDASSFRAEGYDISHLSGKETVGAMTVFVKKGLAPWQPEPTEWRKFKIKTAGKSDDPGAIAEVIKRRLKHREWPYPDLMVIDGGLGQLNAAKQALEHRHIRAISFAKPQKLIHGWQTQPLPLEQAPPELARLVRQMIYHSHRFAIRYHRQKRRTSALTL